MIVFAWWSLSIAAALTAGACGGVIYTQHRIRVVAEEVRITAPWLAEERRDLTAPDPVDVALTRAVLLDDEPRGRHHIGVAIGTRTQRAGWNTPTHQFHALIGATWSAQERAELEGAAT